MNTARQTALIAQIRILLDELESGVKRPRPIGGPVHRVWEICDDLRERLGRDPKRSEVMQACGESGIQFATASTQYGAWRRAYAKSA